MSFLKSLFGLGTSAVATGTAAAPVTAPVTVQSAEHGGCLIEAQPYAAAGQFQCAGLISKEIAGTRREHRFVRADRFASRDEAASFSLTKARQIIDQQGHRLFD